MKLTLSSFLFFLLFGFVISADPRQILFGPLPMNYHHNQALISIAQRLTEDPRYKCSAVVQDHDLELWRKTNCTLITWGDHLALAAIKDRYEAAARLPFIKRLKEEALDAVELVHEFLEAGLISTLKDFKFDMIICDSQNIPCMITGAVLKIERTINFSPTCPPPWTSLFKTRPSYLPSAYTPLDNHMNFKQRAMNLLYDHANTLKDNYIILLTGIKLIRRGEVGHILKLLKSRDELYMAQCVTGLNYPSYHPPNVIDVGPLFARSPKSLSTDILGFFSKFERVVYFGLGSLAECVDIADVLTLFKGQKDTGFIIAAEALDNPLLDDSYPYNILYLPTRYANDVLAHPKVVASINDGDWETILESLYHGVPILSVGSTFDKGANGKLLEHHEVGISMERECDVGKEVFLKNIEKLINHAKYKRNASILSELVRERNARDTIKEWVDYYFEHGVHELVPHGYFQKGSIRYDRVLIGLTPFFIAFLIMFFMYSILSKMMIRLITKSGKQVPTSEVPKKEPLKKESPKKETGKGSPKKEASKK